MTQGRRHKDELQPVLSAPNWCKITDPPNAFFKWERRLFAGAALPSWGASSSDAQRTACSRARGSVVMWKRRKHAGHAPRILLHRGESQAFLFAQFSLSATWNETDQGAALASGQEVGSGDTQPGPSSSQFSYCILEGGSGAANNRSQVCGTLA